MSWRLLLSLVSFVVTALAVTTLGPYWTHPALQNELPFASPAGIARVWQSPELLEHGLEFSVPLLAILLVHELGHWLACRRHGLPASLPLFLPAPLAIGTFGAFIRIRRPIATRRQLLDVGASGPLAGFAALIPVLALGLAWAPGTDGHPVDVRLGEPLAFHVAGGLSGGLAVPAGALPLDPLALGPVAFAAWIGLLVTAFNLLPLGQLDGAHVLFAVAPRLQHRLAWPLWWAVVALGLVWAGWWVWSLLALLTGVRHPRLLDTATPLDGPRQTAAALCLLVFVLSFTVTPLAVMG